MAYCRITHSTAFFSALQGIKSTTSIGSPATEMRLVYDIGTDGKEDERTLSIELGEDGRMTGAKVSPFLEKHFLSYIILTRDCTTSCWNLRSVSKILYRRM